MTTYSDFFSSGLLAGPHMYNNKNHSFPTSPSPSLLSVTDDLDDTSDIELDRSTTPTPHQAQAQPQPQPRLRRRRSSLTVGTSAMNLIKSPSRAAGNALNLQRHLIASPGRSRSGSASSVMSIGEEPLRNGNIASESTSLLGRMRSGSVGSVLKSRRIRRFPGPSFPPPSAPLPPLPSIPGTPSRSKTKAFSIAVSPTVTEALAQKLADASSALTLSRQPFGDLQLHGYGYTNDQEMRVD